MWKMARTSEETSATAADDGQYDAKYNDKQTTHAADYDNRLNRHVGRRHCNDNNDHAVLLQLNDDNQRHNTSFRRQIFPDNRLHWY